MSTDIKEIELILKMHNIKPSHHRIRVLQYLIERKNHPSVDLIYRELIQEIPTLSKTTLYNTLNLFAARGIITTLNLEENESRYDADISFHAHFKCTHCSQIYDIRLELSQLELTGLEGFEVNESHLYFKGICPICMKNQDEHMN